MAETGEMAGELAGGSGYPARRSIEPAKRSAIHYIRALSDLNRYMIAGRPGVVCLP